MGQFGAIWVRAHGANEAQPLRAITAYAGATQLADGTVALILDPIGLARRAGLLPDPRDAGAPEAGTDGAEPPRAATRALASSSSAPAAWSAYWSSAPPP